MASAGGNDTGPAADLKRREDLERQHDSTLALRPHGAGLARGLYGFTLIFAFYHYFTAGFGVPADFWHMGLHLAGLFVLIFACFPAVRGATSPPRGRFGGVPAYDILLAVLGVASALYLGISWRGLDITIFGLVFELNEQALRQGDPAGSDILFGTVMVVLVLEIARRSLGPVLPGIILVFIAFALLGPYLPLQVLRHPGVDWRQFINNMYFPQEGIFGVTLWVVSTVVFHFVLFGVIAQRVGLGQFFIDNAMIVAGRYTGGPAKVSVVSSAFFGTISGSSIANTVSTGSLTIPNMKRLGYPGHFAGGVEAAASAGGQITPPIMGAAAFIMAEFLELPYTTIVVAALVPAAMHYVGVLSIVHFTAGRLGLRGYGKEMLPRLGAVWKEGWPTVLPLIALLYVLFSGMTPFMSAFIGMTLCIVIGFVTVRRPVTLLIPLAAIGFVADKTFAGVFTPLLGLVVFACIVIGTFNPRPRQDFSALLAAMQAGVRYALAVGAAAAAVGIVVGVINTTGLGFRLGFMVASGARSIAETLHPLIGWLPGEAFTLNGIQLFISLCFVAVACILMGAGLPTTALYIMLASVAQPALAPLGIPPLASHLFVLYYGVISEITPPVCASAYAAAGIAGANPFRTGLSAFTLGIGKLLVPMVFVYAPTMLLVLPDYFTIGSFLQVSLTCALGIMAIGAAVAGFALAPLGAAARGAMVAGGLLLVAPGLTADIIGAVIVVALLAPQLYAVRVRCPD